MEAFAFLSGVLARYNTLSAHNGEMDTATTTPSLITLSLNSA